MATNDQIMDQEDQIFLLVKKGQFEALKDGLARLQESHLRRMAAYWLGSQDAMLQSSDELIPMMKDAMGNAAKLNYVLDRLPKRANDVLYYILSEGGSLSLEELRAGFPIKDKKGLREALQPLILRGLVWELRPSAQDEAGSRLHLLSTCATHLQLPSILEGKLGTMLPHRSKEQLHTLVEALEGDAKQLSRNRETIPWL
jgi:hypothetical protein